MEDIDISEDYEKEDDLSKCEEEENISKEYVSEFDGSDSSISSGLDDDDHQIEVTLPCSESAATDLMTLQEDESIDTPWTDDKHSLYLDSMEAAFVHRMYDKEYCSIDVCGHSSHSSISVEQDCVESHPIYINVRKSQEKAIGVLPLRPFTRPWSTSSVLISPWFQHFKSKQAIPAKISKGPDNSNRVEQSAPFASKKREAFFDTPECKSSPRSSVGGGFKILKCQQALSHIDIMMEEQYNTEQQIQVSDHQQGQDKLPPNKVQELTQQEAGLSEAENLDKEARRMEGPELSLLKEKQLESLNDLAKPVSLPEEELISKKSDQLVPSDKDDVRETCGRSVVPDTALLSKQGHSKIDINIDQEKGLSHHSEHEKTTTGQSGSTTWTWDTRGRRYRLGEKPMPANSKF